MHAAPFKAGLIHLRANRVPEAEAEFRRHLAASPDDHDCRLCLAQCLLQQDRPAEAKAELERILVARPEDRPARNMLGEVYLCQGDWEAIRRELQVRMDRFLGPTRAYEQACLQLRFGEMPAGWLGYESRWAIPEFAAPEQHYAQPRWDGAPFPGKTLLLYWEQGFGDTLMFVRFAPLVKALGGRVVLHAQARLAGLVATCQGIDQVVSHGEPLPSFDICCPLLSLPAVLGTRLAAIPASTPYLAVPERVPHRLALSSLLESAARRRIGLVWAGNPRFKNQANRSLPPEALAPLADLSGIDWFSLQVGPEGPSPFPGITPLGAHLADFSDTAHALSQLDALVCVDTAVAHLAGALGLPTCLLLPAMPCWRWGMGRHDSPWYPTLRLYQQSRPGNWAGPLRRLVEDLEGGHLPPSRLAV